jgi:hypothetical protein
MEDLKNSLEGKEMPASAKSGCISFIRSVLFWRVPYMGSALREERIAGKLVRCSISGCWGRLRNNAP